MANMSRTLLLGTLLCHFTWAQQQPSFNPFIQTSRYSVSFSRPAQSSSSNNDPFAYRPLPTTTTSTTSVTTVKTSSRPPPRYHNTAGVPRSPVYYAPPTTTTTRAKVVPSPPTSRPSISHNSLDSYGSPQGPVVKKEEPDAYGAPQAPHVQAQEPPSSALGLPEGYAGYYYYYYPLELSTTTTTTTTTTTAPTTTTTTKKPLLRHIKDNALGYIFLGLFFIGFIPLIIEQVNNGKSFNSNGYWPWLPLKVHENLAQLGDDWSSLLPDDNCLQNIQCHWERTIHGNHLVTIGEEPDQRCPDLGQTCFQSNSNAF